MEKQKTPEILCKNIQFFSPKDQKVFVDWIKKISEITHYTVDNNTFTLHVTSLSLQNRDLRNIIALLWRYNVDMTQLTIFLTELNQSWFFDNKKAYWHKKVFGSPLMMHQS